MEITIKISENWQELMRIAGGFLLFVALTLAFSRYYLNRQKRDAEEGQRRVDEQRADDRPEER